MSYVVPAGRPELREEQWLAEAACRGLDPATFFPVRGTDVGPAKKVCADCPVTRECLAYAIRNGEWSGVYGGLSSRERRILGRRLRAAGDVRLRSIQSFELDAGRTREFSAAHPPGAV